MTEKDSFDQHVISTEMEKSIPSTPLRTGLTDLSTALEVTRKELRIKKIIPTRCDASRREGFDNSTFYTLNSTL